MSDCFNALCAILIAFVMATSPAHAAEPAPHHDLVFGVGNANDPFFKDGIFMLGAKKIKVEQGALPDKKLVSYDDKADKIIVSNDKTLSETDKGAALLQLMDALSVSAIETAAGGQ